MPVLAQALELEQEQALALALVLERVLGQAPGLGRHNQRRLSRSTVLPPSPA